MGTVPIAIKSAKLKPHIGCGENKNNEKYVQFIMHFFWLIYGPLYDLVYRKYLHQMNSDRDWAR